MKLTYNKKAIKAAAIFVVFFLGFYGYFSGRAMIVKDWVIPSKDTSQELISELRERYYGISPFWLERYSVSVRNASDILEDQDGDGLNLFEEYENMSNPFEADTDGDGVSDGDEVRSGMSPVGLGRLDSNNNGLPDDWEESYGFLGLSDIALADNDEDGLNNRHEYYYGTDPLNADTDGDGFSDGKEVKDAYDPTVPGEIRSNYHIIIDKINIDAPIILSKDISEEVLQKDLEKGVIHYPGMTMPGRRGNAYIAGHSSNYAWSAGSYNAIFKDLISVTPGDMITVTETLQNGKVIKHLYEVTIQEEVEADDQRIFLDSQTSILTLTTCWPLGTADRRIMVKAILVDSGEKVAYNKSTTEL